MSIYTDLKEPLEQNGFKIILSEDQRTMCITDKDNLATGELTLDAGDGLHLNLKTVHEPFTRSASMYNINNNDVINSILSTFDELSQVLDPHEMLEKALDEDRLSYEYLTDLSIRYTINQAIYHTSDGRVAVLSFDDINGYIMYNPDSEQFHYTIEIPLYADDIYLMSIKDNPRHSFMQAVHDIVDTITELIAKEAYHGKVSLNNPIYYINRI